MNEKDAAFGVVGTYIGLACLSWFVSLTNQAFSLNILTFGSLLVLGAFMYEALRYSRIYGKRRLVETI